jgi:hypothetical protein
MKTIEEVAKECGIEGIDVTTLKESLVGEKYTMDDELYAPVVKGLYDRIGYLQDMVDQIWTPDCEDIFIVSQTRDGGQWNKIVKSQERWWYSAKEAQAWLDQQEDWFKDSNKVFKARMSLRNIEGTTT